MSKIHFDKVKEFYKETFGVSDELVELMADKDILSMSVEGSSNESISHILNVDVDSVGEVLHKVLKFRGWQNDLNFSPYQLFYKTNSEEEFVRGFCHYMYAPKIAERTYAICAVYKEISDEINRNWV